jgi:serine protease
MFRFVIAALVAGALSSSTIAEGRDAKIDAVIAAKTTTAKEIADAIAGKGLVRAIVTVAPISGATIRDLAVRARDPSTRAAAKQLAAATLDGMLSAHRLSHVGGAEGAAAVVRLTTVPAFSALVDEAELIALAEDPRVVSIEYDRPLQKDLVVTLPSIGAPAVHAAGGTGAGFSIAVIDDGIQRDHVFLGAARIAPGSEGCFLTTNHCPNGSNQQTGEGAAAAAAGVSHGTHVAGIAIGNRSAASGAPNKGVAPAARIVPINVFGRDELTYYSVLRRAYEHIEDLVLLNNGANPHKIASINMSISSLWTYWYNCDAESDVAPLTALVDSLRDKGVLSVAPAGNTSERDKMGSPGCISSTVSVAATSRAGVIASYTNIGEGADVLAPGGELDDCVVSSVPPDAFAAKCGTSMAAPHVAGAIAILKQARPTASACRIEEALKVTGLRTADTREGGVYIRPRIRVDRARARLLSPTPPSNNNFATAAVLPAAAKIISVASTNVSANLEAGEPHHVVSTSHRSVWWRWTPATSGRALVDTVGSGIDTVLAVYAGATSVTSLGKLVVWNDNISDTEHASRVGFAAVAGQTYHIMVAGKTAAEQCSIKLNLSRPPANDNFADAQFVGVSPTRKVGVVGSNVAATLEPGEMADPRIAKGNVWYKFVAPATRMITIDTEGQSSRVDVEMGVYTGSLATGSLSVVDYTRPYKYTDGPSFCRSRFRMLQGKTYHVAITSDRRGAGAFPLHFSPDEPQKQD